MTWQVWDFDIKAHFRGLSNLESVLYRVIFYKINDTS